MENTTLDKLRNGSNAVVTAVTSANRALTQKLLAMGIVAGTAVKVVGIAPLGDPIKIQALGYLLSLRNSEAAEVRVRPVAEQL